MKRVSIKHVSMWLVALKRFAMKCITMKRGATRVTMKVLHCYAIRSHRFLIVVQRQTSPRENSIETPSKFPFPQNVVVDLCFLPSSCEGKHSGSFVC